MSEKNKTFLESRIEQFCDSSAELITSIHAKYSGEENGKSKKKRKKRKNKTAIMTDVSVDINDDGAQEGLV